jgi:sugar/nucleoside kinase (ribokinase family)|tara:strand:+ start:3876 stop:4799 length:924 start_codon:yes stop_codon:yes gene_type:complete
MKKIVALSNLVTDLIQNISEEHMQSLGFEKGKFHIAETGEFEKLRKDLGEGTKIPGGSAANVVAGATQLGAKTGLIGTLGNDEVGTFYKQDVLNRGIDDYIAEKQGQSGVCHTFITPDGERTFVLDFGVSQEFEILGTQFENSHIFHTTAYELSGTKELTNKALELAKEKGLEISFDLADPGVVGNFKEEIRQAITGAKIVFANEQEALTFTGKTDAHEALDEIAKLAEIAVVKLGEKGSLIKSREEKHEIQIIPIENLVNTNGAGDAYAAGFLSAYSSGKTLKEAGEHGSAFAAKACMSQGARISE